MEPGEKATLIALVRASPLPRKQVLGQVGLPKSTYYDWCRRRQGRAEGLGDRSSGPRAPWNKLRPEEGQAVLALARASPELSPRELALRITDAGPFSVSESTCYRLLKRNGLVKPAAVVGFKATKEYHRKTSRPNEMWATDGAYLKVVGWGYYYLVTVLDDYSRFIPSSLCSSVCGSAGLRPCGTARSFHLGGNLPPVGEREQAIWCPLRTAYAVSH
jgi:putative transposase